MTLGIPCEDALNVGRQQDRKRVTNDEELGKYTPVRIMDTPTNSANDFGRLPEKATNSEIAALSYYTTIISTS